MRGAFPPSDLDIFQNFKLLVYVVLHNTTFSMMFSHMWFGGKCPHMLMYLNSWSPNVDTILEDCRAFRRYSLAW